MRGARIAAMAMVGLALVLVLAYIAAGIGTRAGDITFDPGWPSQLRDPGGSTISAVLGHLRLPRVAAAILVGAALAVSGLMLQGVSRNPLADPFLLGISGGAAMSVVMVHAIPGLVEAAGWWVVPVTAFAGAQGATTLVLSLARGPGGRVTVLGLILGGVIINSFCAAVTTFLLTRFAPLKLRITTMWLAGGLGYIEWGQLALCAVVIAAVMIFVRSRAARLNAFALGEEGARLVGVDSRNLLTQTAWAASLLAGVAVSLGGLIGYVGLLVPHLVRLAVGGDFRHTLALSAIGGALLLLLGDTAARTLMSPQEIPVGVLAALIGTPILLVLIRRELRGGP